MSVNRLEDTDGLMKDALWMAINKRIDFTCTGAYAVLIMSGLKRVENRSMMPSPAKGRCSMSVSKKFCRAEYDNLIAWLGAKVAR